MARTLNLWNRINRPVSIGNMACLFNINDQIVCTNSLRAKFSHRSGETCNVLDGTLCLTLTEVHQKRGNVVRSGNMACLFRINDQINHTNSFRAKFSHRSGETCNVLDGTLCLTLTEVHQKRGNVVRSGNMACLFRINDQINHTNSFRAKFSHRSGETCNVLQGILPHIFEIKQKPIAF